jgi:phosphoadenosine phosphosulfate reductase
MAAQFQVESLRDVVAGRRTEEALRAALAAFGDRVALACSFSAEDVVLADMLAQVSPRARVFAIDTGRLHEATYEAMERVRERYGLAIEVHFPERAAVERLEREHGFFSFKRSLEDRHACCQVRKVEPLQRALSGLRAWITGLRREQSVTRAQLEVVERDDAHGGIVKLNPLADWSDEQVWEYIHRRRVPYNHLHDEGYPSIGCEPCTRPVRPGEHPRAGRWWWERPEHKECGLHVAGVAAETGPVEREG